MAPGLFKEPGAGALTKRLSRQPGDTHVQLLPLLVLRAHGLHVILVRCNLQATPQVMPASYMKQEHDCLARCLTKSLSGSSCRRASSQRIQQDSFAAHKREDPQSHMPSQPTTLQCTTLVHTAASFTASSWGITCFWRCAASVNNTVETARVLVGDIWLAWAQEMYQGHGGCAAVTNHTHLSSLPRAAVHKFRGFRGLVKENTAAHAVTCAQSCLLHSPCPSRYP